MIRRSRENIEYELSLFKEAHNSLILRLQYIYNGKLRFIDLSKEDIETMIAHRSLCLEQEQFTC